MDRNTLAACALCVAPWLLGAGCDSGQSAPAVPAPSPLEELQQAAPGAWRPPTAEPVEVAQRETPEADPYAPPARLPGVDAAAVESAPVDRAPAPLEAPRESPAKASEPAPAAEPAASLRPTSFAPPYAGSRRLPSASETVEPTGERRISGEVTAAIKQAGRRVRHGFRLAERNAIYLAKGEFVAALELLAQANDLAHDSRFYSRSLVEGLAALEESRDFVRARPGGKPLDVARIASGHRTPIAKGQPADGLTSTAALRRYHDFALERLATAAAGDPCGSAALFGLAKVAQTDIDGSLAEHLQGNDRAQVLFRAALVADPGNYRAANELGVILAHDGDLEGARELLSRSAAMRPHPTTLRNLASVQSKLGQGMLAEKSLGQAAQLEMQGAGRGGPAVTWVDPATFAHTKPASDAATPPAGKAPAAAPPVAAGEQPTVTTARGGVADWLPWNPRR